jgi:hypothetical protein
MSHLDLDRLIASWLDGRISQSDSDLLQQHLRESAEARETFRKHTKLDAALREVASGDRLAQSAQSQSIQVQNAADDPLSWNRLPYGLSSWIQMACAAALLITVGGIAYGLGKRNIPQQTVQVPGGQDQADSGTEQTIAGYATLRRVAGIQWSDASTAYREGDVLPAGVFEFGKGVAEIDFFCGATLVVEGPAKMILESDWSVRCLSGRLRANVPPAARGFVVKAADSEIIDLGTEFALEVGPENVTVEVVDGEVKLRGGLHDGDHLVTGQSQSLKGTDGGHDTFKGLSTIGDVQRLDDTGKRQRFEMWKASSQQLRLDDRLIAYYPIAESQTERLVLNAAASGRELDGSIVGLVNRVEGRFGSGTTGLEFDRPGARVRTLIEGEYQAFTFACWARIDSLEHRYNALFMGDGYQTGEPHWQIHQDGRLMFSVMVDDTQEVRRFNETDQRVVQGAGLHHVYYSQPFWDVSKSGQWFHIAAVYDPVGRRVVQYVNGIEISSEEITDQFHIDTLRIGPAEIGNWGQPFRETPWFAVRNLNGAIDELAIFNAALSSREIQILYEQGKPLGY